ncbi:MAG: MATE family efflux transporter [Acidimicrobiia bacterium]
MSVEGSVCLRAEVPETRLMRVAVPASMRRSPRDRAIAALALPALATLAIDPIVSIVDTAWVARLGTEPLAALAVASTVFIATFSILSFLPMTITPLVAGEVGRGDLEKAGAIASGSVAVAIVVGVLVAVAGWLLADPLTGAFGASEQVTSLASSYLSIRFLAMPAMLIALVGHGVFRGHSDTRTPLVVAIGMNVVNLILDPILIFGAGLGVEGAAWATVAAQWIAAAWFLVLLYLTHRHRLGIGGAQRGVDATAVRRVLAAGWPMMLRSAALLAVLTATTVAASHIGTAQLAAHQIALQIWLLLSLVLDAYAIAAQAMVGTDLGSGSRQAARTISNRLLVLGLGTGLILSVVLVVVAPWLGTVFSLEPGVAAGLWSIYPIIVVLQPLTALVYVWDGIGIGASAFRYLAGSMVIAGVITLGVLFAIGTTLVGVWSAIVVLTLLRLGALAVWHAFGPLAPGPGRFRASRAI